MKLKISWDPFKNFSKEKFEEFRERNSKKITSFFSRLKRQPKESKKEIILEENEEKPIKPKKSKNQKILLGNKPDEGVLLQRWILLICFFLITSSVGFILGSLLGDPIPYTGAFAVSVASWLLLMFLPTAWKNGKTEYTGIEFLGKFYKTKGPGLNWRIPGVEKPVPDSYGKLGKNQTADIRYTETKLYQPEESGEKKDETEDRGRKNVIDFKDISAPVDIRVYGRIGKDNSSKEHLLNAIYKWMYVMADVPSRIAETADSFFRPILEEKTTEEAKKERGSDLWDTKGAEIEKKKAQKAFAEVGFYLNPTKKILLSDIILPGQAEEARLKAYLARQEGIGRYEGVVEGFIKPVAALMKPVKDGGLGIDNPEKALDRYFQKFGLEVAKDAKNLTLFLNHGEDITKVLDVSGSSQKEQQRIK